MSQNSPIKCRAIEVMLEILYIEDKCINYCKRLVLGFMKSEYDLG